MCDFVTCHIGAQIGIDESAAQRIKKESPAPSAFIPEDSPADLPSYSSSLDNLDDEERRAGTFAIILAVVNGKSRVRLQVRFLSWHNLCAMPSTGSYTEHMCDYKSH